MINAKINQNKFDIFKFVNNSNVDNEVAALAAKVELKAQQDEMERLQPYDSSQVTLTRMDLQFCAS